MSDERERVLSQFVVRARDGSASVDRLPGVEAVPRAVAGYLRAEALALRIHFASDRWTPAIDWSPEVELELAHADALKPDGETSVTGCFAAVAEAGAVVAIAGPGQAAELQFLVRNHLVVVPVSRVVATMEEVWTLFRDEFGHRDLPRAFSLIVGPSRTADLGVPSRLGAHGPERVHILLVDDL